MTAAIAIVGMACRYPDARSPEELWETVLARRRAFRALPEERLRLTDYVPRGADDPDSIYPIEVATLEDYAFDRARFRVPGSVVAVTDLAHWLALDVATDALADAGLLDGDALSRATTAVIVGNTLTGEFSRAGGMRARWPYVRRQVDALFIEEGFESSRRDVLLDRLEQAHKAPFPAPDEDMLAGGLSNTIAGRICNYHDLHGGGYTVDAACASSLLAVAQGCQLLVAREVDAVLVGGVDLSLDPFELIGFARNGALSRSCMRVFDERADGFWPGEGCGFVVLKRADELAADERVRALIRGWGMSTDGAGGLTRPTVAGQKLALKRAYCRAGFGPGSVPLFEAHGTGTAVGDPVEVVAVAAARREAGVEVPAVVGSIKANIGHTKAAAGLAGLIKAVMALEQQILPAATGCERVHPTIVAERDAVEVGMDSRVWPASWPLRAGVSGMGFGGINLHLALERPAARRSREFSVAERRMIGSEQDAELFLFAAADREGLRRQIGDMAALAPRISRAELADAAAALMVRLRDGPVRAMTIASTPRELSERLALLWDRIDSDFVDLKSRTGAGVARAEPKFAFLFPGQAAPARPNCGAWARRFAKVASIYRVSELPVNGDPTATEFAQPAIIAGCLAGMALMEVLGVEASVAVGHSVGELAALHWAGAFDADSLLRLARGRGRAMADRASPGGAMALISGAPERVQPLLDGADAIIACFNAPLECVVSGAAADIAAIVGRATAQGLSAQALPVSHAFHSRFMAPAEEAVGRLVAQETFSSLRRNVISTVTGEELDRDADLRKLLTRQVVAPVRFAEALAAATHHADLVIEIGPGQGMARIAALGAGAPCVALDVGSDSIASLLTAAGAAFVLGAPVKASALFEDRFVREFDLDRPRRFLANPCELAPIGAEQTVRLRPRRSSPVTPPTVAAPMLGPKRTAMEVLNGLLARRLELDVAEIEPDHRLLGDLHLNSIAVGQIVGEAARLLGRAPPSTPTNFAAATVGEAAAALEAMGDMSAEGNGLGPNGVASWMRCFSVVYVERGLEAEQGPGPRNWQIFTPQGHPLSQSLARLPASQDRPVDAVAVCLSASPSFDDLSLLIGATRRALAEGPEVLLAVLQDGGGGGAFARCVSLEHPELRVLVLDLPFETIEATKRIAAEAASARRGYQEAKYDRAGVRRIPTIASPPPAEPLADFATSLLASDVVLVSGGAKGIGAECALALARRTGVRLALIGRSGAGDKVVADTLGRMRAAGVAARYEPADVTDFDEVIAATRRFEQTLGPVTGILHAAGLNEPVSVERLDTEALARTIAVKLNGLTNLIRAIPPERLKLLSAFGSIIARIGLRGEAHYALANEWMEREIELFAAAHPACRALTLEWSVWSGVGMGEALGVVESLARQGVTALAPRAATDLFVSLATGEVRPPTSVMIAGRFGAPPTIEMGKPALLPGRFLERIAIFYPGIEIVAEAQLDSAKDPYLREHTLKGSPLFPAVLGLEAMAEAAAALAGAPPAKFEKVTFDRPVGGGGESMQVRVAALRHEDGRIETVLRSAETGFQAEHFRAIASFAAGGAAVPSPPGQTPTLLSSDELYESLLFHAGRFRRVTGYASLSATSCVAQIAPDPEARWFPALDADRLLIGDPGARDAAIHALQACIPHRRVLPIAVTRIELGRLLPDRPYAVHAVETGRQGDQFVFDVEIRGSDGSVVERWEGLELRAIEPLPALANWPAALAGAYLERKLSELLPSVGMRVALAAGGRSSDALLDGLLGPQDRLGRRADGKPEATSAVSASHAGDLTLTVAGIEVAGCDIEPVVDRPEPVWRNLLSGEHFELARLIVRDCGEKPATAATRVWTALEALKKAGAATAQAPLSLQTSNGGWITLSSSDFIVVTWVTNIERQHVSVAAATAKASTARRVAPAVYSYRHVVGFGETNLVGNVYFVNHLEWQGRCREMFLRDKAPSVLEELRNGLSLLTTKCSCNYLAELTAFDEVRLDMRLLEIAGSRIGFAFEYWRCGEPGDELVATGEQEVACVRTLDGQKAPSEPPAALRAALCAYRLRRTTHCERRTRIGRPIRHRRA